VLFIGDDWAEAHHDVEILDEDGRRLAKRRLPEGIEGVATLHALIADHLDEDAEPAEVLVGIETDRGLGCSPSSETARPLRRPQGPQELLRHGPRSPAPPAPNGWCWPATPATAASPTPSTNRPSPP
jgi:hypothetical protein